MIFNLLRINYDTARFIRTCVHEYIICWSSAGYWVPPELLLGSNAVTWLECATHRVLCPGYANRHPIESLAWGGSAQLLAFTKKTKFELWSLKTFQKNQALSGLPSGLRAAWSTCQYRIIMILCSIERTVQAALAPLLTFTKKIKFESQLPLVPIRPLNQA